MDGSKEDALRALLIEIRDRFHPAILWWTDERAATDPTNARLVYGELLCGPDGAMDYATRLKRLLDPASSGEVFPVPDPLPDLRADACQHWVGVAISRLLALAEGREPGAVPDLLSYHEGRLSLGALIWAASGTGSGLSPGVLLERVRRSARLSPAEWKTLEAEAELDPVEVSRRFREAIRQAEALLQALPPETVGHLFLDPDGNPTEPEPGSEEALSRRVVPTLGGLMPALQEKGPASDLSS